MRGRCYSRNREKAVFWLVRKTYKESCWTNEIGRKNTQVFLYSRSESRVSHSGLSMLKKIVVPISKTWTFTLITRKKSPQTPVLYFKHLAAAYCNRVIAYRVANPVVFFCWHFFTLSIAHAQLHIQYIRWCEEKGWNYFCRFVFVRVGNWLIEFQSEKTSQWAICSTKWAIRSFAQFWWATWAIPSQSLIPSEQPEWIAHFAQKERANRLIF